MWTPATELKKVILSTGTPEWSADVLLDLQHLYREGRASLVTDDRGSLDARRSRSAESDDSDGLQTSTPTVSVCSDNQPQISGYL
jgi:hypothetical protein